MKRKEGNIQQDLLFSLAYMPLYKASKVQNLLGVFMHTATGSNNL